MVSPIGGASDSHYQQSNFPSSWKSQINDIDNDIIVGENNRVFERIDTLIEEIQDYKPQTPNLEKAVAYLKETASLVSAGNPIEAVHTLYEAQNCFL